MYTPDSVVPVGVVAKLLVSHLVKAIEGTVKTPSRAQFTAKNLKRLTGWPINTPDWYMQDLQLALEAEGYLLLVKEEGVYGMLQHTTTINWPTLTFKADQVAK